MGLGWNWALSDSLQSPGLALSCIPLPSHIPITTLTMTHLSILIHFMQGDACDLKPELTDYNVVFAGE